ncbi:MAG: contractile injection system protein, VgrG/Pvc8 family [Spirochaetaceae bacterium]|nr:contractile injection system protein, VgrG/Pvc8 family [Spirochaetaceae bacterium]
MSENTRLVPVWIVYADGKRLDTRHEGALRRITVNDRLSGVGTFSLLFDTAEASLRDLGVLSLGSRVSLHLGYKDAVEEVFAGEILGFRTELSGNDSALLEVTGCNDLHRLHHGRHSRSFERKTPAQIIKALAGIYALKTEIEDFGAPKEFTASREETDLEFMLRLAAFSAKEVYAWGGKLYAASEITVRQDEVIYEWGKNLIEFEAEESIRHLVPAVTAAGRDISKNETFTARAGFSDMALSVGGRTAWTDLAAGPVSAWEGYTADARLKDQDEARAAAAAILQRNSFRFGRGRGSGEGNPKLLPGMRVTIKAAGEAFSGEYIAETVCHRFDNSAGYRTDFTLKRNMSPC